METEIINILKLLQAEGGIKKLSDKEIVEYLDQIYNIYTGSEHATVYDIFDTPHGATKGGVKPVAWYQTGYNIPGQYPESPNEYTGFIPDAINHLIFSDKPILDKTRELNKMFLDLSVIALKDLKNYERI